MIGKLAGTVDTLAEDHAIIDVHGVGYLVYCPSSTLSRLTAGAAANLMIETRVSEDAIRLYGFAAAEEREWFRLLQTVQNVGARVALNVLSVLSSRELARAVALGDKAAVGRAQGVGPKLATRIVTELKDKVPSMLGVHVGEKFLAVPSLTGPEADAVAALVRLGYTPGQAAEVVARSAREFAGAPTEVLLRESLRSMAR
ncbi:MAG TPA: Holliday junction branch migration protein RuvA [Rhizomicrobium sp.]|jgi:Holliday junction DNA helicase RuvA|nr:Holliday junction branch migration protein RuvA [Rhizomicrobium sp.]